MGALRTHRFVKAERRINAGFSPVQAIRAGGVKASRESLDAGLALLFKDTLHLKHKIAQVERL